MATTDKLRAKGTGTTEWRRGHLYVKVSLPDGTRPRYRLCKDVCTCREMSDALRDDRAKAISERERARVQGELDAAEKARTEKRLTVRKFGEQWTSGTLYDTHGEVRGLKVKKSADDDRLRLEAHVYPHIGDRPVADITERDVEETLAKAAKAAEERLGRPWRQATRFQVYQAMRRLFDLAVKPGRLRTDNPVSRDMRPRRDKPKLYSFLYPSEVLAVLGCRDVPLVRRVHYALAVYTGLRKGSLHELTFDGIDFANRTLTSLHSKTGLPQVFEIDPGLAVILQAWFERLGSPAGAPIVRDLGCRPGREAATLRADLEAAGVKRSILFSKADNVEPLRFHDMRATFVTWARRQGRGEGWISDRTGHLTKDQLDRYDRGARMLADMKYQPFPDIASAVPEFSATVGNVRRVDFKRGG